MKKLLKNKKTISKLLVLGILLTSIGGTLGFRKEVSYAKENIEDLESLDTYYEIQFIDNTPEKSFFKEKVDDLDFKFYLSKTFETNDGGKVDSYSKVLTNKEMEKLSLQDNLSYRTSETYPYYTSSRISLTDDKTFIAISSTDLNQDYYIGDISTSQKTEKIEDKDINVFVLTAPIYKLNRNIEKTIVNYEGDLKEETKSEILDKVKEANPNIAEISTLEFTDTNDNYLYIKTLNRTHTEIQDISFITEDLIKRVADVSTQTMEEDIKEDTVDENPEEKDLAKLEENLDGLKKEIETIKEQMKDSKEISQEDKDKITNLEKEKTSLKKQLEEAKAILEKETKKEEDKENQKIIKNVEDKISSIDKTLLEIKQIIKKDNDKNDTLTAIKEKVSGKGDLFSSLNDKKVQAKGNDKNEAIKTSKQQTSDGSQTSTVKKIKESSSGNDVKEVESSKNNSEEEKEIRYSNKLTPKTSTNPNSNEQVNQNKGVASEPSKARASVTENVDNANNEFPIHHGNSQENLENQTDTHYYSADARQFVTFTTKSGKTFHLIINHDEDSENVMLLTEVSEDDLLNMVESKTEVQKEEPIKIEDNEIEETKKEEEEPVKQEETSNAGTYLLVGLVIAGVLGGGYYSKVVKAKENDELASFEEDDDYYYSEAEDYIDSNEDEDSNEEEDIDSEDLL